MSTAARLVLMQMGGDGLVELEKLAPILDAAGFVIVPKEPTESLADHFMCGIACNRTGEAAEQAYRDLIAAASPPSREGG